MQTSSLTHGSLQWPGNSLQLMLGALDCQLRAQIVALILQLEQRTPDQVFARKENSWHSFGMRLTASIDSPRITPVLLLLFKPRVRNPTSRLFCIRDYISETLCLLTKHSAKSSGLLGMEGGSSPRASFD